MDFNAKTAKLSARTMREASNVKQPFMNDQFFIAVLLFIRALDACACMLWLIYMAAQGLFSTKAACSQVKCVPS